MMITATGVVSDPVVFATGPLRHALGISERQLHVARWICRGCTNYEIAARLGVSLDTARMHTKSLYKKLKVRARLGVPVRLVLTMAEMNGRAVATT